MHPALLELKACTASSTGSACATLATLKCCLRKSNWSGVWITCLACTLQEKQSLKPGPKGKPQIAKGIIERMGLFDGCNDAPNLKKSVEV